MILEYEVLRATRALKVSNLKRCISCKYLASCVLQIDRAELLTCNKYRKYSNTKAQPKARTPKDRNLTSF
jgi:hypothetical protein